MSNRSIGPWSYASDGIYDMEGYQIASLIENEQQYFKSRGENMVNGKIMAASAEMLDALVALKDCCKHHDIRLGSGIIHQIDLAISKATE